MAAWVFSAACLKILTTGMNTGMNSGKQQYFVQSKLIILNRVGIIIEGKNWVAL